MAPTTGFGVVRPSPRAASSSALRMKNSATARSNWASRWARGIRGFLIFERVSSRIPPPSRPPRPGGQLALLGLRLRVDQLLQLGHELRDVAEAAVHGGEAHVGHLVQLLQA